APKDLIRPPSRPRVPEASGDAPVGAAPVALSGPERSLLLALREREGTVVVEEEHETVARLTPRGEAVLARGLPERRFLDALRRHDGSLTPAEATEAGLDEEERSAAIGILRRRGVLADGLPFRLKPEAALSEGPLPE